jgi:hypothetical protein
VKIADFGISSQLDSTHGMCSTFVVRHTGLEPRTGK